MKFLKTVKYCTFIDVITNANITQEQKIFSFENKMTEYKIN